MIIFRESQLENEGFN